jgi:hypothetical protein
MCLQRMLANERVTLARRRSESPQFRPGGRASSPNKALRLGFDSLESLR